VNGEEIEFIKMFQEHKDVFLILHEIIKGVGSKILLAQNPKRFIKCKQSPTLSEYCKNREKFKRRFLL